MSDSELKTNPVTPLPSVITSFREDIKQPIDWDVVPSAGDIGARVDFSAGVIAVPLSGDSYSQRVQLRKLVEARITPVDKSVYAPLSKKLDHMNLTPDLLHAAEAGRINVVTERFASAKGIVNEPDGSEKTTGKRLAMANTPAAWDKAVEFTMINAGTKAFDSFASGIRSVNPQWSKNLRALNKEIKKIFNEPTMELGNTAIYHVDSDINIPSGFIHSIYAARAASNFMSDSYKAPREMREAREAEDEELASNYGVPKGLERDEMPHDSSDLEAEGIPNDYEFDTDEGTGFDNLRIDDTLLLTVEVEGYMRRRRKARQSGIRVSYPSRMLTDPQRRVFGQKVKVKGGVVVIDISGSMSLQQKDLDAIVEAAPASLILAYSSNVDAEFNAWILANRGWRVRDIPSIGNVGNGVDGPALTWAIRHRKFNEPIVWVCDGLVTNRHDRYNEELAIECAKLVKKHRMIMIPSVDEAVQQFKTGRLINKPSGPIKNILLGKTGRH